MAKHKHTASAPSSPASETKSPTAPVADAPKPPDEAGGAGSGAPVEAAPPADPPPPVADSLAPPPIEPPPLPPEVPAPPPSLDEVPGSGLLREDLSPPPPPPEEPERRPEPPRLSEEEHARREAAQIVADFVRMGLGDRARMESEFTEDRFAELEVDVQRKIDDGRAAIARAFFTTVAAGIGPHSSIIAAGCLRIVGILDRALGLGTPQSFRVTATSRYVVPGGGGITELREGSIVSAGTHDLAAIRSQGVPLEACETPRAKHGPLADIDRGLVPSPMFRFEMSELPTEPEGLQAGRDADVIRRESGR